MKTKQNKTKKQKVNENWAIYAIICQTNHHPDSFVISFPWYRNAKVYFFVFTVFCPFLKIHLKNKPNNKRKKFKILPTFLALHLTAWCEAFSSYLRCKEPPAHGGTASDLVSSHLNRQRCDDEMREMRKPSSTLTRLTAGSNQREREREREREHEMTWSTTEQK